VGAGPRIDWFGTFATGSPLVADTHTLLARSDGHLLRIDAATGDRFPIESDVPFIRALAAQRAPDGRIVAPGAAYDGGEPRLLLIDPRTGDPSTLSGPDTGSGPAWQSASDVAVGADGVYVLDDDAVLRVDPQTGERSIVSDPSTGTGELFHHGA